MGDHGVMSNITINDAIRSLRPNSSWAMTGDSYDQLKWISNDTPPTEQEVNDTIAAMTTRDTDLTNDGGLQTLLAQIKTASASQIDTWLQSNVTSIPKPEQCWRQSSSSFAIQAG
jgi:hypothetical protein